MRRYHGSVLRRRSWRPESILQVCIDIFLSASSFFSSSARVRRVAFPLPLWGSDGDDVGTVADLLVLSGRIHRGDRGILLARVL